MTEADDVLLLVTFIMQGAAAFAFCVWFSNQRFLDSMVADNFWPALSQSYSDHPITVVQTHTLCPLMGSLAAKTGRKRTQSSQSNNTNKTAAGQPVPSRRRTQAQRYGHEGSDCTRDAPVKPVCWPIQSLAFLRVLEHLSHVTHSPHTNDVRTTGTADELDGHTNVNCDPDSMRLSSSVGRN